MQATQRQSFASVEQLVKLFYASWHILVVGEVRTIVGAKVISVSGALPMSCRNIDHVSYPIRNFISRQQPRTVIATDRTRQILFVLLTWIVFFVLATKSMRISVF